MNMQLALFAFIIAFITSQVYVLNIHKTKLQSPALSYFFLLRQSLMTLYFSEGYIPAF